MLLGIHNIGLQEHEYSYTSYTLNASLFFVCSFFSSTGLVVSYTSREWHHSHIKLPFEIHKCKLPQITQLSCFSKTGFFQVYILKHVYWPQ